MAQPSQRKDLFGTEGVGDEGDPKLGTAGHASQGGTATSHTGGTQGNRPPGGNPANRQTKDNAGDLLSRRDRKSGQG